MSKTNPGKKTPFELLISELRDMAVTEREKGRLFEELTLAFLTHEPDYKERYPRVWRFGDWVEEEGQKYGFNKRDTGIDLVALRNDGQWVAIQCKFYVQWQEISKKDLDSFLSLSSKKPFGARLIVTTSSKWGPNAKQAIENQNPPVSLIKYSDLAESVIDWSRYHFGQPPKLKDKKSLRPHQKKALEDVLNGFKKYDRGKLIMPCGSGKTFTALKIAEKQVGPGGLVVFFMPTLALLDQTIREWTQQSEIPITAFAVCSDIEVGLKNTPKKNEDDESIDKINFSAYELSHPPTTQAKTLAESIFRHWKKDHLTVIFSTYHSLDVLTKAQKKYGLREFDLVICDEAHRTTGYSFEGEDESTFIRVHDNKYILAKKRLYMTATPRVWADSVKAKADEAGVLLCSMDDEKLYGPNFHILTFHEAVSQGILSDYKVIVIGIPESEINRKLEDLLSDSTNELKVSDASRIVGAWKALSKLGPGFEQDATPMKRVLAYCSRIDYKPGSGVSSKLMEKNFVSVVERYKKRSKEEGVKCEIHHVDGSMGSQERESLLAWLKEDSEECRIVTNVRCLSEGVDVPALDGVIFFSPKKVQYEVVQAVGRVMRKAPGKKYGYVILPVVIPAGQEEAQVLDNNQYRHVWQVLQALRSHDDRLDAEINKMELNGPDRKRINVIFYQIDKEDRKTSLVSVSHWLPRKPAVAKVTDITFDRSHSIGVMDIPPKREQQVLYFTDIERAFYARIVQKCGNRRHWEDWAKDIAQIAQTHIDRIKAILENKANVAENKAFEEFARELRDDLNEQISDEEIIEMLAQHMITKPVFDALFENYPFASKNPVSRALDNVLNSLALHHLEKERDTLNKFYESVRLRASGIESAEGRQKIILELYDKFFRSAFPKMSERLGIVYTPVEIVDFIIKSVEEILQNEFNTSLANKNVHILDPFVGTGTFITRLLQSGIIPKEKLSYKYKTEIHANEMVLLAYYIAAINIESVYHDITKGEYTPFPGICFTDTFQLYEKEDILSQFLPDNSDRRQRQQSLDIRVIVGNPPYSAGQSSANDNNQNVKYPKLDAKIAATYARYSSANLQNKLYDSYIRAIRWASDRLEKHGKQGVIGFVTNAGWLDSNSADGLRKCLAEEFSKIYVFHLRGNARTSGDLRRKEGDNVFGMGTRAEVAISLFVKTPNHQGQAEIYFCDIGDYLSREEKLEKIRTLGSIGGISRAGLWQRLVPDKYNDWLNQRDESFGQFLKIGDKKEKNEPVLFENYSLGIATNRDVWVYNFSKKALEKNMRSTIDFYNSELARWQKAKQKGDVKKFIKFDRQKISWVEDTIIALTKGIKSEYSTQKQRLAIYRPFVKMNLYWDSLWNQRQYQLPRIFPTPEAKNRVICVTGRGSTKEFSCIMTDIIPDLELISKSQCFPLYLYDREEDGGLFGKQKKLSKRYAITKAGLQYFQEAYPAVQITEEDVFYYVYGLLHSPQYRQRYANNLAKELPRIPRVKSAKDFLAFTEAGRKLAELHVGYEKLKPWPAKEIHNKPTGEKNGLVVEIHPPKSQDMLYHVEKMRFAKIAGKSGPEAEDKSTIIYNTYITLYNVPLEAYEYVVNGKSAIEWVMERYQIKVDKESGIVNDPNDWAKETACNNRYIFDLLLKVIRVSIETVKIVKNLPELVI